MKTSQAHRSFENSRLAVFVSGRGSNLQSLLNSPEEFPVSLVVSNRKKAEAVLKARRSGVPVLLMDKQTSWDEVTKTLKEYRINLIYLLGFMKILPESFCREWEGRMINIHPSLLPLHPGLEGFEKSFQHRSSLGVSVHEVTAEMDAGPLIFQKEFLSASQINDETELEKERMVLSFTEHRLIRESGRRCL